MPIIAFFAYVFLETIAFWALARWIGIGWALLALFATMFFGMAIAGLEARRIMSSQLTKAGDGVYYVNPHGAGKTASNVGLALVGGMLLTLPGFLSSIAGALLLLPPTRAIIRTVLAASLYRKLERFGARLYERTPMSRQHTSYGSFGGPAGTSGEGFDQTQGSGTGAAEVIDEEELGNWSKNLRPEDFRFDEDGQGGNSGDGSGPGGRR